MGGGSWDVKTYTTYATSKGRAVVDGISTTQNMFVEKHINEALNPYKVIRECCDSEEHPNTIPVILALDVTGSMGDACKRVAQSLNIIMTDLYKKYKDIEFMIMAIGDLAYDNSPIQASQFESDIRIAEQTDKIYFEGGGGGNAYESYTAAWYFGLNNCKLDCWNRNKKGIIITLGDEPLNPYLPIKPLAKAIGLNGQDNIETQELYNTAIKKYDIYHVAVKDEDTAYRHYEEDIEETWGKLLGENFKIASLNTLPNVIGDCIKHSIDNTTTATTGTSVINEETMPVISW